ncbi:uncharacterized protein LOC122082348 isoform X2 [Macadamia integrifolia]|uniref:uncharacterized protein LOC122082348 isoform X2 n=1 Tax=Macadamia integrifolia TaxID=60698 RepID=UPI001C4F6714|nr:uncharacterized protein LOC122082348 isoform X2 [Macadamia integrifolia]XP_042505779.1 uncharacterized protein LOC122082348 isoform X2 [Macadamia integrifolia]
MLVPYSSFVAAAAAAAADGPLPLEGWLHNNHHSNDELPIQFSFLLSLGCSIIMFLASYALNALHQIAFFLENRYSNCFGRISQQEFHKLLKYSNCFGRISQQEFH